MMEREVPFEVKRTFKDKNGKVLRVVDEDGFRNDLILSIFEEYFTFVSYGEDDIRGGNDDIVFDSRVKDFQSSLQE